MNVCRSFILTVLLVSFIFPASVFAQTDSGQVSPTSSQVNSRLKQSNAAMQSLGVVFYDADGRPSTLLKALESEAQMKQPTVKLLIPANSVAGIKKSLGIKLQRISMDANGANFHVAYTDENFSKELVSDNIPYDFHLEVTKNAAITNVIVNKMTSLLPQDYAMTRGHDSLLQKTFGLILPQAHADDGDNTISVGSLIGGIIAVAIGSASLIWGVTLLAKAYPEVSFFLIAFGLLVGGLGLAELQPLYQPLLDHNVGSDDKHPVDYNN